MKVTYIFHSSFFVETENSQLLFDYYTGRIPEPDREKPLYVFASHSHGDHFSRKIFNLALKNDRIHYFLSDDISRAQVPEKLEKKVTLLAPEKELTFEDIRIRTLPSNDLGVAFVIDADGKHIYHAGDLNNWWWEGDGEDRTLAGFYHAQLEKIRGEHFDCAFIPLDPRIKGWWMGIEDFLSFASADYVFPMHFGNDLSIVGKMLEREKGRDFSACLVPIDHAGESFTL